MIRDLILVGMSAFGGGWSVLWGQVMVKSWKQWLYDRSEQGRLARSAEIQHKALETGHTYYGVFGNYQPEGSPTALQQARAEAEKLQEALH
jgi:hypothetical protein